MTGVSLAEFRARKFAYLLVSLLGLLIAGSFVERGTGGQVFFNVMLSLTLLASIIAISRDRRFVVGGIVIAAITFALAWVAQLTHGVLFALGASLSAFLYFQYTAGVIVVHIFKAPSVTSDELLAAISAYLLLGIGGGFIFQFLEFLDPETLLSGVASVPEVTAHSSVNTFIYYSFTCLTTLGFGDVIPGTPQARVFSYLAAVIGQIYLTVLIARFVGLHISQSRRR